MPTVVPFNLNKNQANQTDCRAVEFIKKELGSLTNNKQMVEIIMERMQSFIKVLDYDLTLHVEINEHTQEAMLDLAPAVQDLQTRFSNIIEEIIAERILHEVAKYHAEKSSQ